ncbi:MepB family protein [Leptospira perdikensis]|uniref:MepB protein n=1 Tax=Leptospira perdikensis TaxID=2484948 RepID=A0A4R9JGB1_9LEPT|nr:MepB family protein [Leptospira perdikensis]TGL41004.1 MepB protein [Leptospira perdikensis]
MNRSFTAIDPIPPSLKIIKERIFDRLSLPITNIEFEEESSEYDACYIQTPDRKIRFRKAKITPKKIGQFVTLWKRSKRGPIEPFHVKDDIDFYIIATNNKTRIGCFLFTKQILGEKGILTNKREGKRGFRVYPAWDKPINKQGSTTQNWQLPFFVECTGTEGNLDLIVKLLEIHQKV